MIRGLYTATTGMLANQKRIDAVSDNLANGQTVAFKREEVFSESFNDVLLYAQNGSGHIADKGEIPTEVTTDGQIYRASTRDGYYRVETERGISNNREVEFYVNPEGELSTYYYNSNRQFDLRRGYPLLDQNGNKVVVGDQEFEIRNNGDVVVDGEVQTNLVYQPARNVVGTINGGVLMNRRYIDFEQGQLESNNEPFSIAIQGEGFFKIKLDGTEIYTRNGSFKIDRNRTLVTGDGYPVLGFKGEITLEDDDFTVNEFGEIISGGELIDKFDMINFSNFGDLIRVGGNYYQYTDDPMGEKLDFDGKLYQGMLEQSNSDAITEMIRMVNLQREYESNSRAVRTIDEMLAKAATEVGRV